MDFISITCLELRMEESAFLDSNSHSSSNNALSRVKTKMLLLHAGGAGAESVWDTEQLVLHLLLRQTFGQEIFFFPLVSGFLTQR